MGAWSSLRGSTAQKIPAAEHSFGARNHDVVTTPNVNNIGSTWTNVMLSPVLILAAAFVAGFCSGFATRAWRSRKRRAQYRIYAPYVAPSAAKSSRPEQPVTAFGHMRRAF
ncbi:hypothetical protein ACE103_14465 [Bradyrhizobium sp. ma5]|uniref:hypothetical protein n=1 Tax=Bradyrhizobium sp. ma5 TaxID=3344828 RepID=UPI0035D516CE